MKVKGRKYSIFIRPLIILIDILIINGIAFFYSDKEYLNIIFLTYTSVFWILISLYTKFYNVFRYTHVSKLVSLIISQFFVFVLAFFAYFTIFREGVIVNRQIEIILTIIISITILKFLSFFLLKSYRSGGKNYRNVIVIGENIAAKNLTKLFNQRQDLGYRFFGFFSDKVNNSKKYLGTIPKTFQFVLDKSVDEIYCEASTITQNQLNEIRKFANSHKVEFRLIPENKAIYSKDFILEHYGTIPILKPKQLPFEKLETHIIKRTFDILFSIIIFITILWWLLPIVFFLVKIDSKGPLFFKQKRDGIGGKQFYCYKIRSMKTNEEADKKQATKNDERITKIGAFLRRSSLDELPQFYNVLKGDMSVVGPRPHINIQTEKYIKEIDNYLIRNSVKPGITGLAQISGYRGEVIKKSDIKNRVKFDIFYIENWSFFLDMKIIFQTILKVFKGEEKAY